MRFEISVLHCLLILSAGAALAKEPPSSPAKAPSPAVELRTGVSTGGNLNVEEAIRIALRNNPELRVFEASVAASKGGVTTAKTFANPELTIAPGVKRTRDGGVTTSEFHGEFELSQLFKFPGKRALEIAIAQRNVALQELALEGFRFQLTAKVRKAFYEMLAAQKVIDLRKEQVESAKTFVASAQKRAESGYASDFETMKSQADLIAASRSMHEAQGEVVAARVSINTLMGRDPAAPLEISGALENVAPPGGAGDYLALAMARNPSLRTQAAQAELAGLTLRSTRFGRRPDFAVGPKVEYTENEQIYGIGATIALPFWDQKRGEIETATGEQRKALAEIEKTRVEIAGEVTKAAAGLKVAKESAALYTEEFLRQLRSFVGQAEQGYAQSATTLIIYLDAKRTYFDTLSSYYEALGKVAAGRAELESAIGVPLEAKP
jgi:cobalt-zinc-cadmium efflux system outer membrane protein